MFEAWGLVDYNLSYELLGFGAMDFNFPYEFIEPTWSNGSRSVLRIPGGSDHGWQFSV